MDNADRHLMARFAASARMAPVPTCSFTHPTIRDRLAPHLGRSCHMSMVSDWDSMTVSCDGFVMAWSGQRMVTVVWMWKSNPSDVLRYLGCEGYIGLHLRLGYGNVPVISIDL